MSINKQISKIPYPRGSEWKKWDLHIHTPASYDWDENCNASAKDIVDKVITEKLSVIAITDHHTIKGIDDIVREAKGKNLTVLPGVELRTDKGNKGIHIIGLFNSTVASKTIYDKLLCPLNLSEDDVKKKGNEQIYCNFKEACQKIHELSGLVLLHAGNKSSSIEQLDSDVRAALKKDLAFLVDIFEVSNEKQIDDYRKIVFPKIKQEFPCIITSDACDRSKLKYKNGHSTEVIGKKFTWIKANPTFEGLKQIIYEPKLRVSEKPELYLYPQIISVQLQGAKKYQTLKDKEDFSPITLQEKVWLNPNLTTIIGPRASGKTVLVELLSYPLNKHLMEVKKEEKLPLIPFLAKRFPNLIVTISYQQGEQEAQIIERKITDLSDPFYVSPLNIEYWRQGQIEEVADKKGKINEYTRDRLSSPQLLSLAQEIDKLKEKLKSLREKCFYEFETEIKQKNLSAERKQIEEYFEKLKTQEYKNLIKKIRDNRTKNQLLDSFIKCLEKIIESLNESKKQIGFTDIPEINQVLKLFSKNSSLCEKISEFYRFTKTDFIKVIKNFETLKELIEEAQQKKVLEREELQLKNEFLEYCKKNGIKITQIEYEKRTSRLNIINRELKEVEAKLREYAEAKQGHNKIVQELQDKLAQWKQNNEQIIQEFNKIYSKSNIRVVWDDPINRLSEWIKEQFLASDLATKLLIRNNYHISSPARVDFVGGITKELVMDKKYSVEKIIEFLQNQKRPPLEESRDKEENLKWFFQREETRVLREDLTMRLQEYGEKGNNLIQYKKKILGKDTMSFGERCGTVIELILHSGDHPLIIDQPEEHLDSKFIADRVVDIVREQKINRQIIVCTHNANIVVLGDSELVTVLSVDERGTHSSQGSLENSNIRKQIYDVLEGGPEAFRKRGQKYGLNKFFTSLCN